MLAKIFLQSLMGWVLMHGLLDPSTSGMLQELLHRNLEVARLLLTQMLM